MFRKVIILGIFICLFTACSRKDKKTEPEVIQPSPSVMEDDYSEIYDIYIPALDNGDWVEEVLAQMEEERIAEDAESLSELESLMRTGHPFEKDSGENVEVRLLDSYQRLKMLEYGKEIFVPDFSDGKLIFVNKSDEKVTRFFYDESYRLIKKEFWKITTVADSSITLEETFSYNGDSVKPQRKTTVTPQNKNVTDYNSDGLPVYSENSEYSQKSNTYILKTKISYDYDSEQRITMEEITDCQKNFTKRQNYSYKKDEEIPPDYEYYENGELKIKTTYTTKTEYTTQVFFDDSFSVITYYDDGKKLRDEYYNKDTFVREKIYE